MATTGTPAAEAGRRGGEEDDLERDLARIGQAPRCLGAMNTAHRTIATSGAAIASTATDRPATDGEAGEHRELEENRSPRFAARIITTLPHTGLRLTPPPGRRPGS